MFTFEPTFQMDERIESRATNQLVKVAKLASNQLLAGMTLPPPFRILTKRSIINIDLIIVELVGVSKIVPETATPLYMTTKPFGRQDRKLVIEIQFIFSRPKITYWGRKHETIEQTSDELLESFWDKSPAPEKTAIAPGVRLPPMLFRTNVQLFPLNLQQAAFVGARPQCTNDSRIAIIWGTRDDVDALRKFPKELCAS